MYRDPMFYLKRIERYGPVFKVSWGRHMLVCFARNADAQVFYRDHRERLRGISLSLEKLFPKGFLRNLRGDDHLHYRKILASAFHDRLVPEHADELRQAVRDALAAYAGACRSDGPSRAAFLRCINLLATRILVRLIYGLHPDSPDGAALCALHDRLGPDGLVWQVDDDQAAIFAEIRSALGPVVDRAAGSPDGTAGGSCLAGAVAAGPVDETLLGNLVYMVEMGRYDLYGLLHWIAKYINDSPETIERLRHQPAGDGRTVSPLAGAVVLETLRLDQGEGVLRRAREHIVHDGWFFPRGTVFRACLWDNHKNETVFPDPFRFDPNRFVGRTYTADQYASFGLDHHRCLAGTISVQLGGLFVEELARSFEWTVVDDGPRHRGTFHWEPSERFTIDVRPRAAAPTPPSSPSPPPPAS